MINDNKIASIIFVPADDNEHILTSDSICGSKPPIAIKFSFGWESSTSRIWHGSGQDKAIVLAWDGKIANVGCDLICRAISLTPMNSYTFDDALILGRRAEFKKLGTCVIIETPSAEALTTDRRMNHIPNVSSSDTSSSRYGADK